MAEVGNGELKRIKQRISTMDPIDPQVAIDKWLKPEGRNDLRRVCGVLNDATWSAAFHDYGPSRLLEAAALARRFADMVEEHCGVQDPI